MATFDYWHESGDEAIMTRLIVDYDYSPEVKLKTNCEPYEADEPCGEELHINTVKYRDLHIAMSADLASSIADAILEDIHS